MALEDAEVAFAKALVRYRIDLARLADRLCRQPRAGEIAREDGIDALADQALRESPCLPDAGVGQRHIELTLDATFGIPGCFSMADQEQRCDIHALRGHPPRRG